MRDFKKIKAYQYAENFVIEIYKLTSNFPKSEIYGITSQIRRSALSVPANIAEGASRQHTKEYLNFLYISRGSIAETECFLRIAIKLGYLNETTYQTIMDKQAELSKTLCGLINAVSSNL